MEKKIIYVADDGIEFEDERECEAHERNLLVDKLGDHLRLWDEDMKPIDPKREYALQEAYFIYADTPEVRVCPLINYIFILAAFPNLV